MWTQYISEPYYTSQSFNFLILLTYMYVSNMYDEAFSILSLDKVSHANWKFQFDISLPRNSLMWTKVKLNLIVN